ncbi:similar to thyroid hormone receptor interactor 4 isoform 4 [Ectocarpus siliculosus]|uniref:Similar to thyroid hormone receptor interactor 4 isoform 4 n=1 Tax=Ectocarpus siliculosus TaxID=2880 RepID=D7FU14_ECTSI|nr:similar to thyroid hormone receptor interactor 4 isoform 4 [Ectocarpus siliculosus]|eukprot:CBJ31541.1 similar to thyroid hormone receptor interactor 4 isoform 4 [Ectocarpus siliculosus]
MGKTHDVVTNCTDCGKIACVKEGGFGCSFCGCRLPTTGREPRSAASGGVDGAAGATAPQSAALKEALERKDRLLLFDRTSASRTRVLDDQGDYFTSHNWLSQREREKGEAEEKVRRDDAASRRGARRQVKMSIDIMGRRVIETQDPGEGRADGGGGEGEADDDASKKTQGVSLDFGSSSAAGGGAAGSSAGAAAAGSIGEEAGTSGAGNGNQRLSLENTGLRGRAKEVYDVMRANLDKKSRRRRPRGAGGKAVAGSRIVGAVPETSRVNLWRVQHDVDSDDLLRQSQASGGGGGGGAGDGGGFGKFEPADELACAR